MLLTVYSDIAKGAICLLGYLAVIYVAVPILDIIGRTGTLSKFRISKTSLSFGLCIFAVP